MAEHELELAAKFGLPEWGGFAAKLEAKYRAAWGKRGTAFVEAVADGAGLDANELGERLLESEGAADTFRLGLNRASEVRDEDYITALGRAVAGALDDATVETDSYIVREISKLEPAQLRAFLACFRYGSLEDPQPSWRPPSSVDGDPAPPNANVARAAVMNAAMILDRVDVNGDLAMAALEQLAAAGFLVKLGVGDVLPRDLHLRATGLGVRALSLMFPDLEFIQLDPIGTGRVIDGGSA